MHALSLGGFRHRTRCELTTSLWVHITQLHRSLAGGRKGLRSTDRGFEPQRGRFCSFGEGSQDPGESRVSIQTYQPSATPSALM